ncbi:hypothetical protein GCM10011506_36010 [Marivirga lumbricoides]|uniref:DUF4236 domain-containing protein n=1 Tax=Marivirga lumbricoides TaxID=1046115 RepID=A0A2T4DQZ6_9BACT|nr:hypothetical protein C9994_08370 [Marivirga lumbricoides]GGC47242.1 hypothetical protein GCM10011506_36010 [Marivirga lumbricoides]
MSLRYQKRINLGKGAGLNISKKGTSFSKRTKYGSIGSRGFSLKTGIPGLSIRKNWGKGGVGLAVLFAIGAVSITILIVYNTLRLIIYLFRLAYYKIKTIHS